MARSEPDLKSGGNSMPAKRSEFKLATTIVDFSEEPEPEPKRMPHATEDERKIAYRLQRTKVDLGSFDDDEFYSERLDDYVPSLLRLTCPHCGRRHAPLIAKATRIIAGGWEWIGLSHQEPYTSYLATCPRTREHYVFKIRSPQ